MAPHKYGFGQVAIFDVSFDFETRIVPTASPKGPYEVLRVPPPNALGSVFS